MILDQLYLAIRERLLDPARGLAIRQVDRFHHQPDRWMAGELDGYILPAALVRHDPLQWKALGRRAYQADATVYIDVMQLPLESMANDATVGEEAAAQQAYANVQAVAAHLNALRQENIGTFTMLLMEQDHAYTHLRVDTIAFRTRLFTTNDLLTYSHPQPDLEVGV